MDPGPPARQVRTRTLEARPQGLKAQPGRICPMAIEREGGSCQRGIHLKRPVHAGLLLLQRSLLARELAPDPNQHRYPAGLFIVCTLHRCVEWRKHPSNSVRKLQRPRPVGSSRIVIMNTGERPPPPLDHP